MIHSLKIKNYKSIGESEQILDNLGPVNVLIGENGSGKTAALEALWLFGEILLSLIDRAQRRDPLAFLGASAKFDGGKCLGKLKILLKNIDNLFDVVYQKGKNFELEVAFRLSDHFNEVLEHYTKRGGGVLNKKLEDKVKNLNILRVRFRIYFESNTVEITNIGWGKLDLLTYKGPKRNYINLQNFLNLPDRLEEYSRSSFNNDEFCRNVFIPEISNFLTRLADTYYIYAKRQIKEVISTQDSSVDIKGANLKKDLYLLFHGTTGEERGQYKNILEVFYKVTDKKIRETPFVSRAHRTDVVFQEGSIDVNIDNTGYGYYQILLQIYNILTSKANIILIDEPELSLHPQIQVKLFEVIKEIANKENKQFFVATHSPYFIDLQLIDKVYKFTKSGVASTITKVSNEEALERIKKRGETVFHFRHRELFFMDKVIFVEGNKDLSIFPHFFEDNNINSFLSKEYLYHLTGIDWEKIKLFSSFCKDLGIKYAFVVDADFLRKGDNKERLIKILTNIKQAPKYTAQLLKILNKEDIKKQDKQTARDIWTKNWNSYWMRKSLKNMLDELEAKHIFVMPFYDIKVLVNTKDRNLFQETINVFTKIKDNFTNHD